MKLIYILLISSIFSSFVIAKEVDIKQRVKILEQELQKQKNDKVKIGGAIRVNYSNADYSNEVRDGDLDFDMFRLDFNANQDKILISAQIRFFQYMYAIRHAWIGYEIDKSSQIQVGVVPMPFGVHPYNSNNFFFSPNYYLGLEDTQASGVHYKLEQELFDLDLGFYKNDDMGGVDGYVQNRNHSYTYSILGTASAGQDINTSSALAENNTFSARTAFKILNNKEIKMEVGLSALYGTIVNTSKRVGDRYAYALHSVVDINSLNIKLQATQYNINLDDNSEKITVGAYAWNDEIATKTTSYTGHLAYTFNVNLAPISQIKIYNDYSLLTNKSGDLKDTVMNAIGAMISSGKVYTYVDYLIAKNMPFIGANMVSNSDEYNRRFNINVGYYF